MKSKKSEDIESSSYIIILACSGCFTQIAICDKCRRGFIGNENIICSKGKHYCIKCSNRLYKCR